MALQPCPDTLPGPGAWARRHPAPRLRLLGGLPSWGPSSPGAVGVPLVAGPGRDTLSLFPGCSVGQAMARWAQGAPAGRGAALGSGALSPVSGGCRGLRWVQSPVLRLLLLPLSCSSLWG